MNLFPNDKYIFDGGMGQYLIEKGMVSKGTLWSASALIDENLNNLVLDAHLDFINSGAQIIVTNNFKVRKSGHIAVVSSLSAYRGLPYASAYGASKAGLLNLARTQALEWAPKVRVSSISPGFVSTEDLQHFTADLDALVATVPAGRLVSPEDVAAACVWLASEDAALATGSNLVLEGGGDWPAFLRPKS